MVQNSSKKKEMKKTSPSKCSITKEDLRYIEQLLKNYEEYPKAINMTRHDIRL